MEERKHLPLWALLGPAWALWLSSDSCHQAALRLGGWERQDQRDRKKPHGTVLVCLSLTPKNAKYATTMFPNIQVLLKERFPKGPRPLGWFLG